MNAKAVGAMPSRWFWGKDGIRRLSWWNVFDLKTFVCVTNSS
jgi:hypothetical protein